MMDDRLEKEAEKVAKTAYPIVLDSIPKEIRLVRPKCQDCLINCTWRSYFLEIDEEHLCPMLEEQERKTFSITSPVTRDNIEYYSAMALSKLHKLISPRDPREMALFHKCLTEHKKVFHPEINKSVSLELSNKNNIVDDIIDRFLNKEVIKDNKKCQKEE